MSHEIVVRVEHGALTVNVVHHFPDREGTKTFAQLIVESEKRIVSALSDKLNAKVDEFSTSQDETDAAFNAALARVQADVSAFGDKITALEATIADLKSQLANPNLTEEEAAAITAKLDAAVARQKDLTAKLNILDPTKSDVMPPPPDGGGEVPVTPPDVPPAP